MFIVHNKDNIECLDWWEWSESCWMKVKWKKTADFALFWRSQMVECRMGIILVMSIIDIINKLYWRKNWKIL